jgi:hypothetical protein
MIRTGQKEMTVSDEDFPSTIDILIVTPASVGVGPSSAFEPDLLVATDTRGFPYIPRQRLIMRLRQVADHISRLTGTAYVNDAALHRILRSPNTLAPEELAVEIGSAELSECVRKSAESLGHPRAVTAYFTRDDAMTSNAWDGRPIEGSMRTFRRMRAGWVYSAPLRWHADATIADVQTLAKLLVGLEQIGGKESRGWGYIQAAFGGDWDKTVCLAFKTPQKCQLDQRASAPTAPTEGPSGQEQEPCTRKARLTLEEDLIISHRLGQQLSIPGQQLRGAVASALRSDPSLFKAVIVDRGVKFGSAHPTWIVTQPNTSPPEEVEVAFFIAPVSLGTNGKTDTKLRNRFDSATWGSVGGEIIDSRSVRNLVSEDLVWTLEGSAFSSTVQRVNTRQDLYFESRVVPKGTSFQSTLDFCTANLAQRFEKALENQQLLLGANRSTYGGRAMITLSKSGGNAPKFPGSTRPGGSTALTVVLRTPALVRLTATGEYSPLALGTAVLEEIRAVSNTPITVKVNNLAIVPLTVSSFGSRYWGMRGTRRAAGPGSTVALGLSRKLTEPEWAALCQRRIGERQADGFGEWGVVPSSLPKDPLNDVAQRQHPRPPALSKCVEAPHNGLAKFRVNAESTLKELRTQKIPTDSEDSSDGTNALSDLVGKTLEITAELVVLSDTSLQSGVTTTEGRGGINVDDPEESSGIAELFRDDAGTPTLRGTTLAGLLRHQLERNRGIRQEGQLQRHKSQDARNNSDAAITRLFGKALGAASEGPTVGCLSVFDSPARERNPIGGEGEARDVRSYIAIEPRLGTPVKGALFSLRVLPAGTTFPLRLRVTLPQDKTLCKEVLNTLVDVCDELVGKGDHPARIRFGARTHVGLGAVTTRNWQLRSFDLRRLDEFEEFYSRSVAQRIYATTPTEGHSSLRELLPNGASSADRLCTRQRILINGKLWVEEPLPFSQPEAKNTRRSRIRYGGMEADGNKMLPLSRPFGQEGSLKHVEPWSGVHGTLKAYARRELSRLVGSDNPVGANNATEVLEGLFGSEYGGGQIPSRFRPEPSHFRPHPEDSKLVLQTLPRVAIDPITQGASEGALFEEEGIYGGFADFITEVEDPTAEQRGLLWLALWGLSEGLVSDFGAGANHGYGRRLLDRETEICLFPARPVAEDGSPEPERLESFLESKQVKSDFESLMKLLRPQISGELEGEK